MTTNRNFLNRALDIVAVFQSAARAAAAVRVGRDPNAADLRAMGIAPADFARISRP